ncbi:class I lanthipeptide [Hymenobacter algoricola]|uniref:Natural product n=1 Tax=Hymenobacter algoricola TaxID=486267 RepID=A0ABP7NR12_9BACT
MKKQDAFASKLSFNKEKVASLTPDDLDQVHGGDGQGGSYNSSYHNFTCCICTMMTQPKEEITVMV